VRGTHYIQNRLKHCIRLSQHVVVPEPQHAIPLGRKPGIARSVSRIINVLSPIELNHQPALKADEVCDVRANRLLTTELHSLNTPAA